MAFRNVEQIKGQFHEILSPIDALLSDIERTKAALHDTTLKLAAATWAHDQLRQDHVGVVSERDSIAEHRDNLLTDNRQLAVVGRNADSALGEAQLAIGDRTLKIERLERELESASRRILSLSDETQQLRAGLDAKEKALADVEQKRASLFDQHNIAQQEGRALRTKIEDQSAQLSKISRQSSDLEARHNEVSRRAGELEAALTKRARSCVRSWRKLATSSANCSTRRLWRTRRKSALPNWRRTIPNLVRGSPISKRRAPPWSTARERSPRRPRSRKWRSPRQSRRSTTSKRA